MASSGTPREIYIFGIVAIYIFFGLAYASLGNAIGEIQSECANKECLPQTNSTGLTNNVVHDNGLFAYIFNGFDNMPEWINVFYVFLSTMIAVMLTILVLHG